jgi:ribosomal protein S18 acetylase RimI-like enzyme
VGACLLDAAMDYARAQGYRLAQLDVIDTNPRARAFYESHGFSLHSQRSIWPFHRLFGFRRVQTLTRRVQR